jgi:hypothetical protein
MLGATVIATLSVALPSLDAQQAASDGYTVPRTAWGDPDLQGKWPGTEMVGVPMQRDERLGATVLIVTHDRSVAESCPRTLMLRDGRIVEDLRR